ncbi:MAG: FAD:protein FMN transferase [Bacteroidales bacterium]
MKFSRYLFGIALIGVLIYVLSRAANDGPYISIAGFTQGTTYHMTYQSPTRDSLNLKEEIDELLARFDQSLSSYIDTSNLSRINRNITDRADAYLIEVFNEAKRVYEISDGAFDITVGPLVDAWGFGPGTKMDMSQEVVDSLMQFVGMDKVSLIDERIIKAYPEIRIDVNAIAQGYSVDVVCDYLSDLKIRSYLVEIGGEIRTRGLSPRGDDWKVGIDKPIEGNVIPGQNLQEVVRLSDKALASSGNYRKYFEIEGEKIVHTIDPATGYTQLSNLLSVTIITDECMTADAYSTTCMVLGLEKAKKFVESLEGVEALFIYSDEDGLFLEWMTDGMEELLL